MKELKSLLKIVSDSLKTLAQGVEVIAGKVDEVAKSQSRVKPRMKKSSTASTTTKVAKKPLRKAINKKDIGSTTAADTVLTIISRSKKGVNTATIKEKTGYNQKKVANIIYKLKKQGRIKTAQKGVYVKV